MPKLWGIRCPECDALFREGTGKLVEVDYCPDCGELFPITELREGRDGQLYCVDCLPNNECEEE